MPKPNPLDKELLTPIIMLRSFFSEREHYDLLCFHDEKNIINTIFLEVSDLFRFC